MSIHKKISASLNSLSGESRAQELEARLKAHRSSSPSKEERSQVLTESQESGRKQVYDDFANRARVLAVKKLRGLSFAEREEAKKSLDPISNRLRDTTGGDRVEERKVHAAIATRTGVPSLDFFLGGGLPAGFIEIYGPESAGKTSLLTRVIRSAQHMGKQVMMTSTEFFDAPYFVKNGVELDNLLMIRSGKGEQVLEAAAALLDTYPNTIYVIDSATGLRPPKDEYDNWVKMITDWMEHVSNLMDVGSCVVMVNQVRAKRSADPSKFFAGGTDSAARKAAGMFSTRLELSRTSVTEAAYDMVVNIVANTLKAPAKIFPLPVVKGKGVDVCRDLVRVAAATGVIEQRGSWYSWNGDSLGQGEEEVARYLEGATWARETIEEQTLRALARG